MQLSKGAEKIMRLLRRQGYVFELEKTFSDCKSYHKGISFRFDFFVHLKNENILIEYDGEPHFKRIPRFHRSEKEFLAAKERDRIKNSYALSHKIKLYRIPFWEIDNIEEASDIFQKQFEVHSMWHNDLIWRKHQKS